MQLAFIIGLPSVTRSVVESSDPDDLQVRVQGALDSLDQIIPAIFLAAVNLSGAGDGDKWMVELVAAPAANLLTLDGTTPPGAPVLALLDPGNLTPACYKAADVRELAVQRDRAIEAAVFQLLSITVEEVAGATQGLQHMGLLLLTEGGG